MTRVSVRRRLAALTVVVMTTAMAIGTGVPGPAPAEAAKRETPAKLRVEPIVPVTDSKPEQALPSVTGKHALTRVPEVSWPTGTVEVDLPAPGARGATVRAGTLPVYVRAATAPGVAAAPARVRMKMLDRTASAKAGLAGLLLEVSRADGVTTAGRVAVEVDYAAFERAYGGDWANRLQVVELGAKHLVLPSTNDHQGRRISTQIDVGATTTFAVTAAASGSGGDYAATSLSSSGAWQMSGGSGSFSWTHPIELPGTPGGLEPEVGLSYSSGSVDGRTASTNSQPSWVGEGWDLSTGYLERSYLPCHLDGGPQVGDLCWAGEQLNLSFGSRSGAVIRDDGTGTFRLRNDDGTRIEQLDSSGNGDDNGEYWRLTTTDGVQYYFGQTVDSAWTVPVFGNQATEPCNRSTFAASWCEQAYRWNLNKVVDPQRNTITYSYTEETNSYARNLGTAAHSYTRAGYLSRIDYGSRVDGTGDAPARVQFTTAERCLTSASCGWTAAAYPDVPVDLRCNQATCPGKYTPTFWTTKRLATITTEIRTSTGYVPVDSWTFRQTFPSPNDTTPAALWLAGITRTGHVGGTLATPEITFDGDPYENRVNSGPDGLPPMTKYRLGRIHNASGGTTNIVYAPANCTPTTLPAPGSNPKRCFPVHWKPEHGDAFSDWFHRYVVERITEDDRVGGNATMVTDYEYVGDAAWRYNDHPLIPAARRTWSEWRGYEKVIVRTGDPTDVASPRSTTRFLYFRGMNGDRLPDGGTRSASVVDSQNVAKPDDDELAGTMREEVTVAGGAPTTPVLSATISDPWRQGPTATQGTRKAYLLAVASVRTRTALAGGGTRDVRVDTTYNAQAIPTTVHDHGDTNVSTDDRCTTTSYARNESSWLLTLPSQVSTVAVACGQSATLPADAISDTRTFYDGKPELGAQPEAGNATRIEEAQSYDGAGRPSYVPSIRSTYDDYGRPVASTDALDQTTRTTYVESHGLTTKTTVANPLDHTATKELDPARGLPTRQLDANDRATTMKYDALGRRTEVKQPGSLLKADLKYSYGTSASEANWVQTQRLNAARTYTVAYALFDGFLRPRQTQGPAWGGGRVVADTFHDSRGLVWKANAGYRSNGLPAGTVVDVRDNEVLGQTVTTHDAARRPTRTTFLHKANPRWATTTSYDGEKVHVNPPAGGTPTTTVNDAHGRVSKLVQYSAGAAGAAGANGLSTTYTYTKAGQVASLSDPDGNEWTYAYDVRGLKTSATDPDSGTTTFTYDKAGQQLSTSDSRGKTVRHAYDALGRKTEQRDGAGKLLASWTYDTLLNGLPTASKRHVGTSAYVSEVTAYDAANRPTRHKVTIPGIETGLAGTYETTRSYRDDGSAASLTLPAVADLPVETITFDYDSSGRPAKLTGRGAYVTATTYTPYGELGQLQFAESGAKVWQTRSFEDGTRRLVESHVERQHATDTQLEHFWYDRDPTGNVTSVADKPEGHQADIQCMRYDQLRQLTAAWSPRQDDCATDPSTTGLGGPAPYWLAYEYDDIGNRTKETRHATAAGRANVVRTFGYPRAGDEQPHSLRSVTTSGAGPTTSSETFAYDVAGNTVSRLGQTLDWAPDGELATVMAGGSATTFVYDADGNLLIRKDPGSRTLYLDDQELRYDEAARTSSAARSYTYGGSTVATRTGADLFWLTADQHGTATTAVNVRTGAVDRRRFDPFGAVRSGVATWPGSRGFLGKVQDDRTGLTHLGAREYDPSTGRFLSVDPLLNLVDPQQMHGYAYGNNNPSTLSDPTGLLPGVRCPDGECAYGGYRKGQSPASTFNANSYRNLKNGQGTRCPDGARTCKAVAGWKPPWPKPKPKQAAPNLTDVRPFVPLSHSVCVSGVAAFMMGISGEACLSFDSKGIAANAAGKDGLHHGPGILALNVGDKLSSETADQVNRNRSSVYVEGGPRGARVWGGELQVGLDCVPGASVSECSVSVNRGAGIGYGSSLGSGGFATGRNSGYVVEYDEVWNSMTEEFDSWFNDLKDPGGCRKFMPFLPTC